MLQNERQQHVDSKGRGVYLSMLLLLPHSDMPINVEVRRRSPLLLSFAQKLSPMALLSTVLGFSAFGLASRFGQLAIQRRNLMDSMFFSSHPYSSTRFPCRPGWTRHCHGCVWVCRLLGTQLRSTNKRAHCMEAGGTSGQGG